MRSGPVRLPNLWGRLNLWGLLNFWGLLTLWGLPILLASCGSSQRPQVCAAASLSDVLRDIVTELDLDVDINIAATSTLVRQLEAGNPATLFFAASVDWMDRLDQKGLLAKGSRRDLVRNSLVMVAANQTDSGSVRTTRDRVAVADPTHVPAGLYAKAALQASGEWDDLKVRLVPCVDVRGALALVERGEVGVGIVYRTDALASSAVTVLRELALPDGVVYQVAALQEQDGPVARRLLSAFCSPAAMAVFRRHGFVVRD